MKRILSAFLLTLSLSTQAGLPPTTLSGQSQTVKPTTFSFKTPYNQSTKISGTESLIETGNANVLADPGAEALFTPWSAYKDAAGVLPVDGTGGTPDYISCINSSTGPLAGTKSFLITKQVAANAQGEGCSIPFTIPTSSTYKVNRLAFDYAIASGTYADDEIEWFVYDVTNATVKPFTPSKLKNHSLPSETFAPNGEFQASGSTSYRLIAHVASTSAANEWALKFDNFKLGVFEKTYGRGDTEYSASVTTTSGVVSGENRDFVSSCTAANPTVCTFTTGIFTLTPNCTVTPVISGNVFPRVNSLTSSGITIQSVNASSADVASVQFSVSCQKSGTDYANASGLVMSNDADTRVYDFSSYKSANQAVTAGITNISFTAIKDSHGSWSTDTFSVKTPGDFRVTVNGSASATTQIRAYVDGVLVKGMCDFNAASNTSGSVILTDLKAGNSVTLRSSNTVTISGAASTSTIDGLYIERISGPSQIAASDSVSASYWLSANFTSSGTTPINFNSKEWDSHSAVTVSPTAWKFTAPSPGEYTIEGVVSSSTPTPTLTMWKGTSAYKPLVTATTPGYNYPFVAKIKLLQGEYISVRSYGTATFYGGTLDALSSSHISITRTGNY